MGTVASPRPVKLIAGLLYSESRFLIEAHGRLQAQLGKVEFESPDFPFNHTDYYIRELGSPILRRFYAFQALVDPFTLPVIKKKTNALEVEISRDIAREPGEGGRAINIDPGYMTLSKLVLATTKDHSHRLYLGEGIYGETTLRFVAGRWEPWPWTYPDYAEPLYHAWFIEVRERLKEQLRERGL